MKLIQSDDNEIVLSSLKLLRKQKLRCESILFRLKNLKSERKLFVLINYEKEEESADGFDQIITGGARLNFERIRWDLKRNYKEDAA